MSGHFTDKYFNPIKEIWSPFRSTHRIIPFCTAVIVHPSALIIGTNHSDFVKGGGPEAERIADAYSNGIPSADENTFLIHSHRFAQEMQRIPAHKKHRVDWTTPDEPTVWLGVRYGDAT